jgi:hypothetical protein
MLQAGYASQSPHTPDPLGISRDRLAEAVGTPVAGRQQQWTAAVRHALAGIARGLRRRIALADTADGPSLEIDCTRATLARQADGLCHKFEDLLAQTIVLGDEVGDWADPMTVRRGVADLLAGLEETQAVETELVLESVNTDLGVGD